MENAQEGLTRTSYSPYFPLEHRTCLWNPMPIGESLLLGNQEDRIINVECSERCLRLAHKHALQEDQHTFQGFLLGSIEFSKDERNVVVILDRFDPGMLTNSFDKLPSAILPNDVVVPILLTRQRSGSFKEDVDFYSSDHLSAAFRLLHETITGEATIELSRMLTMTVHCVYDDQNVHENVLADIQFHWNAIFVSNIVLITPVKSVPIIPTALAKTLVSTLDLMQDETIKTGFLTMDQTRKLLLMLDSDPKACQVTTVGIWISYIESVFHPALWMACLRYLSLHSCKRALSENNEFLLLVYSAPKSRPCFYKCSTNQFQQLNYDMVLSEHSAHLDKHPNQLRQVINVTLDYAPPEGSEARDLFETAHRNHQLQFASPRNDIRDISNSTNCRNNCSEKLNGTDQNMTTRHASTQELTPSPLPQPLNKTAPVPAVPTVLEPSLIFDEDINSRFGKRGKEVKAPPEAAVPHLVIHQHPTFPAGDPLVPSLYEGGFDLTSTRSVMSREVQPKLSSNTLPVNAATVAKKPIKSSSRANSAALVIAKKAKCLGYTEGCNTNHCDSASSLKDSSKKDPHRRSFSLESKPLTTSGPQSRVPAIPQFSSTFSSTLKKQPWFRRLPNEACQFYIEQDQLIHQLLIEIEKLKAQALPQAKDQRAEAKVEMTSSSTQTDTEEIEVTQRSVGVGTDCEPASETMSSNCTTDNNEGVEAKSTVSAHGAESCLAEVKNQSVLNDLKSPKTRSLLNVETTNPQNCVSESGGERSNGWDSASFQLDASVLNGTSNEQSITSSLQAVDIPGLDTSEDNNLTPRSQEVWNQDSPVLGESASMYAAALSPSSGINKDRKISHIDEVTEDKQFFSNLLKQVQEMLEKGENESKSSLHLSTASMHKKVNSLKYTRKLSGSLLPHLAYLGVLANNGMLETCDVSTLVGSSSGHELSMHANAIALKYLTDDQLTSIASAASADDLTSQILPSTPAPGTKQTIYGGRYSGMSLLSPCDMSLATKRYMQKYGLVENEDPLLGIDEEVEKENDLNIANKAQVFSKKSNSPKQNYSTSKTCSKESTPVQDSNETRQQSGRQSCSVCSRRSGKSDRSCALEPGRREKSKTSTHWSQLQNNLGETIDMLHPFLNDLEKKEQFAPPIQDHNPQEKDTFDQEQNNQSYNVQNYVQTQLHDKVSDSGVGETIEQILSPRILESLNKANRKLKQFKNKRDETSHDSTAMNARPSLTNTADHPFASPSQRNSIQQKFDKESDAKLMPPPSSKDRKLKPKVAPRSGSVDRLLQTPNNFEKNRRMSSSPTDPRRSASKPFPGSKKSKDCFERVLDSQVMQAFNKDRNSSMCSEESCNDSDCSCDFFSDNGGNILNLKKIRQLPKLS